MHLTSLHYLFLIPVGLAIAFMLWVLWSVSRQLTRGRATPENQPRLISIRIRDRFCPEQPPAPASKVQIAPRASPTSAAQRESSYSTSREFSDAPPSPVLGAAFRRASSSEGQAVRR